MKLFKRYNTLSFRISMILIVILLLTGWAFSSIVQHLVTYVTNSSRCVTMANIVCGNIEGELLRIESVVKAGALSSTSKRMTPENSKATCDSIKSMAGVDSVYVAYSDAYSEEITHTITLVRTTGASVWSEPHAGPQSKSHKAKVTFVTPLRSHTHIYAVLCADVSLEWLKALAQDESATENTTMEIVSNGGTYIYHYNDSMILTKSNENENENENENVNVNDNDNENENENENENVNDNVNDNENDNENRSVRSSSAASLNNENENYNYEGDKHDVATVLSDFSRGISEAINETQNDMGGKGQIRDFTLNDSTASIERTINQTGWKVNCIVPIKDHSWVTILVQVFVIILLSFMFFILAVAIIFTIRWQLRPLRQITDAMERVSKGNFTAVLPKVHGHTEIRHLRDSFERMQIELEHYINDLRSTTETKAGLERDIQIASLIQQGMLPKNFPAFPDRNDIDIYGLLKPAKLVGGDIFDFFIRDNKLFFCIGDVSGKGVPAALIMTVVGHLFRNVGRYTFDPMSIVSAISTGLADGNDQDMFCTLFVGVLDIPTGLLNFCNAGHNAPVIIRQGKPEYLTVDINIPAGIVPDYAYTNQLIHLSKGDTLFLYTDGVTEAESRSKTLFGDTALLDVLSSAVPVTMKELSERVHTSVQQFADGAEQSDDLTILSLRLGE